MKYVILAILFITLIVMMCGMGDGKDSYPFRRPIGRRGRRFYGRPRVRYGYGYYPGWGASCWNDPSQPICGYPCFGPQCVDNSGWAVPISDDQPSTQT
jgi:hypothetical protein